MLEHKKKRDISRENLEAHRIFYNDQVECSSRNLPEHVDAVRETLLSFENIVPSGRWQTTLRKEAEKYGSEQICAEALHPTAFSLVLLESHEVDRPRNNPLWNRAFENLCDCQEVAKEAQGLSIDAEDGWTLFWRNNTFTLASQKARKHPGFQ